MINYYVIYDVSLVYSDNVSYRAIRVAMIGLYVEIYRLGSVLMLWF